MGRWIVAIATVVGSLLGVAVRRWAVMPARVENYSMEPTYGPGQLLLARKFRLGQQIHRGDVVLVRSAELNLLIVK